MQFILQFFHRVICKARSIYFTRLIDNGGGRIIIAEPFMQVRIIKRKGAKLNIQGDFRISPHVGGKTPVYIELNNHSTLNIEGDFIIGHGVRIMLSPNAYLHFGGKEKESDSGITADTLIMVKKKIVIGKDFICAWGVFISDSDWHQIGTQPSQANIDIGNHVWIANNSTVLKGSIIGENSILASQSKISQKTFPPNSLLAGTPAQVVKSNISWSRDVIE